MHFNIKRAEPVHETYSGSKSREIWRVKIQVKSLIFIKTHFWAEYQRKCFIIVLFMFNIIHLVQWTMSITKMYCPSETKQIQFGCLETQDSRTSKGLLWNFGLNKTIHFICALNLKWYFHPTTNIVDVKRICSHNSLSGKDMIFWIIDYVTLFHHLHAPAWQKNHLNQSFVTRESEEEKFSSQKLVRLLPFFLSPHYPQLFPSTN